MEELAEAVQEAIGESVELAYVDQGYTGEKSAEAAKEHGIRPWSSGQRPSGSSCCCLKAVGGGARFRVDDTLSAIGQGL